MLEIWRDFRQEIGNISGNALNLKIEYKLAWQQRSIVCSQIFAKKISYRLLTITRIVFTKLRFSKLL